MALYRELAVERIVSGDDESTLPPRKRKVSHDLVDVNGDGNKEEPTSSSGCNSAASSPEKKAEKAEECRN